MVLRPLIQRLMRRLYDLALAYGDGPLGLAFRALLDLAETVAVRRSSYRYSLYERIG